MQEADIVISRYFSDKERSAELLNYCFFQRKDIIKPEYLTELDGNLNALDERKKGEKRYGDQIWKVKLPEAEVLFGVEHQMKVHYFMPFRQWGYELRQYEKQYYQISRDLKKRLKDKEFLSGVKKEQKYLPVIRLTVYWNQKEPWDGEKKIQNLIKLENVPEQLQKKIPNYEMNLLEIRDIEDIEVFRTDLRLVLGFLKRMENKKELETFIQNNKEEFCFMPEDTYDMIWVLAGERKLKDLKKTIMNGEERYDMCQALDDMREESRKLGEDAGKKVGKKAGLEIAMKLTKLLIEDGRVEDLKKVTENKKYQTRLLKEYQLI